MLIKISTDTWRDIFDFLSPTDRRQFALKFNELGDREFSNVCQKWLHEWTKNVCLEKLWIDGDWDTKLARLLNREQKDEVPFAEVEMPDNITDFEEIYISYVNTFVLNFLRRMQPLFRSVNLRFYFVDEVTRTTLTHLLPLFSGDGIESLVLLLSSNQLLPTIRDNFQAQFFGIKILFMHIHGHAVGFYEFVELYLPWLSTIRADGQPRMLTIAFDTSAVEIIDRIRQNFLETTSASGPVSFFISLSTAHSTSDILESITQNAITNEQLVIRKTEFAWMHYLLIGRCPAEVDGQTWIEEMDRKLEEANKIGNRTIAIAYPTIGQIEEAQQQMDGNEVEDDGKEEDADQQPGPSNRI